MNKKYLDGMKDLKASEELKKRLITSVKEDQTKKVSPLFLYKKIVATTSICIFVIFLMVAVPLFNNQGKSGKQALFSGFTLTAYATNGTPIEVKPNIEFPLGEYQVTMSSVPGFPLKIECKDADTIKLKVSDGQLLSWKAPDGKVINLGQEIILKSGDTIYWTPLKTQSNSIVKECNLVIKAYKNNTEIGRGIINIKADKNYTYTGKVEV